MRRLLRVVFLTVLVGWLMPCLSVRAAVSYIDADGTTKDTGEASVTMLYGDLTAFTWNSGWYAVSGADTKATQRIIVNGEVNLILCDGAELTASEGITVAEDTSTGTSTIATLNIYGQSEGTGKLFAGTTNGEDKTAQDRSAGIGGEQNGSGGTITINGGTITVNGNSGAGIGGGYGGSGGTITINGGDVKAKGSAGGAGIGGGYNQAGGTITISGGTVKAEGANNSAGIGGGNGGSGGNITISGGTVEASGTYGGAGIGGGFEGAGTSDKIEISGGIITATGGTFGANAGAGIGGGNGKEGTTGNGSIIISGGIVTANGGVDAKGIGAGRGSNLIDRDLHLGTNVYLRTSSDNTTWTDPTTSVPSTRTQYMKTYISIPYIKWDENKKELIPASTGGTEYTAVTEQKDWSNTNPNTGWYVVSSDVTIDDRITATGTVNLILCDGCTLTAKEGIAVNYNSSSPNSLNIYGQEEGTGKLIATGPSFFAGIGGDGSLAGGTITISGGAVMAIGGEYAEGIGNGAGSTVHRTLALNNAGAFGRDKEDDAWSSIDVSENRKRYMAISSHKHTLNNQDTYFIPWMESNSLPNIGGNYYLTQDVTITNNWDTPANSTINLCLNGKTITAGDKNITVSAGTTLNLYDCKYGNGISFNGGSIIVNGICNINAGKISGPSESNTTTGVIINGSAAEFTMLAGVIQNFGTGISYELGKYEITNIPFFKDNTVDISFVNDSKISITENWGIPDIPIRIKMQTPGKFANTGNADLVISTMTDRFTSVDPNYYVSALGTDRLQLVRIYTPPSPSPDPTPDPSPTPEPKKPSTVTAADQTFEYNGKAVSIPSSAITVTGSSATPTVKYYDADKKEISAPTNPGSYFYKAFVAEDENYLGAESDYANLTITKAKTTVYITSCPTNVTYHVKKQTKLKKNKSFIVEAITNNGKPVSYSINTPSKKIKIDAATGKVTVGKGLKKGTYKVKVTAAFSGEQNYEAGAVMAEITIKVKK